MQAIESAQNPKYKALLKVTGAVAGPLKKANMAWCEGLHLLHSLWPGNAPHAPHRETPNTSSAAQGRAAHSNLELLQVWCPHSLLANSEWQTWYASTAQPASVFSLPDALYAKASGMESPTGPLVVFRPPPELDVLPPHSDCLVLDGIQDPGNAGTMLRTAVAAGVQHVLATEGSAWLWSEKVLRAGMGAHRHIQVVQTCDPRYISTPVYATSLSPSACSLYALNLQAPAVWVFGAEGAGVSKAWLAAAARQVFIPQTPWVESLNVGAACAVALFEQSRQRR